MLLGLVVHLVFFLGWCSLVCFALEVWCSLFSLGMVAYLISWLFAFFMALCIPPLSLFHGCWWWGCRCSGLWCYTSCWVFLGVFLVVVGWSWASVCARARVCCFSFFIFFGLFCLCLVLWLYFCLFLSFVESLESFLNYQRKKNPYKPFRGFNLWTR